MKLGNKRIFGFFKGITLLPFFVLFVGFAVTYVLWRHEQEIAMRNLRSDLEERANGIQYLLELRIQEYQNVLSGVRGFFEGADAVTPDSFHRYFQPTGLFRQDSSIQSVSVSRYVPADALERHVADFRARGFSEYGKNFSTGAEAYAPIVMIEPASERNLGLVGFDNFSTPERKAVLEDARDNDEASVSPRILLNRGEPGENAFGILMFAPVYWSGHAPGTVEDRRRKITGWVGMAFRTQDFAKDALDGYFPDFLVRGFDGGSGGSGSAIFETGNDVPGSKPWTEFRWLRQIQVLDREWTVEIVPLESFKSSLDVRRSNMVLVFGAALSVIVALLVGLILFSRARIVKSYRDLKRASEKLSLSEARYRTLFESSRVALIVVDGPSGNIVNANGPALRYYGFSEKDIRKMSLASIGADSPNETLRNLLLIEKGEIERFETRHLLASGELRDVEISASPVWLDGHKRILAIVQDITERKRSVERIMEIATHDELTGLPNRSLLTDRLSVALAHADRSETHVAVMFVDLDNFKSINDSIGHDVGDVILREATGRMLSIVRHEDTVARQGGDEFVIVLSELHDPAQASLVAQKVLDELRRPFEVDGHELHLGASIGISAYPKDARNPQDLIKFADIAMYRVKSSGRNGYRFFAPDMHKASVERQIIVSALHRAIGRDELTVAYQPLVRAKTEETVGMECLIRWNSPTMGPVSPDKFIPIAEETGLIVQIGEKVLRDVCRQIGEWKRSGLEVPRVAVNLSVRQFRNKTLTDDITAILEETGTDPRSIGFEITESMLVENVDDVALKLKRLSSLGIEISLDDFGTGYSSLSYLKSYPIKKIKIDRSFVNDLPTDLDDIAIVNAIITLSHSLGMAVVAEGVETKSQLSMLREMGCDIIQGYYYDKPLTAREMEARLARETSLRCEKSAGMGNPEAFEADMAESSPLTA